MKAFGVNRRVSQMNEIPINNGHRIAALGTEQNTVVLPECAARTRTKFPVKLT